MNIGENIRRRRAELGLSQARFASALNVSQAMLCQIEQGTKLPGLLLAKLIADELHCTIDELFQPSEREGA